MEAYLQIHSKETIQTCCLESISRSNSRKVGFFVPEIKTVWCKMCEPKWAKEPLRKDETITLKETFSTGDRLKWFLLGEKNWSVCFS